MAHANVEERSEISTDRRDFLYVATGMAAAVGAAAAAWPFIDQLRPSADVLSQGSIDVDLSAMQPGQRLTIKWRGKPVFVDYRTPETVEAVRSESLEDLKDPETDRDRVVKDPWLVVIGVCTHLGCIPLGQGESDPRGDWGGWFCPCHGSHYDRSGRIRKGPAPENLIVPPYAFLLDEVIRIGGDST